MSNYTLLEADGASGYVRATGTEYLIEAEGDFDSGTLTPKIKSYDGTAITYGSSTLTADGAIAVTVPKGKELGAVLSGSTSPSLKVHITKIK